MSRRIPNCAHCGGSLRRRDCTGATAVLKYEAFPGKPSVGWHLEGPCLEEFVHVDLGIRQWTDADMKTVLRRIHERGEGRLVANKAWWSRCVQVGPCPRCDDQGYLRHQAPGKPPGVSGSTTGCDVCGRDESHKAICPNCCGFTVYKDGEHICFACEPGRLPPLDMGALDA